MGRKQEKCKTPYCRGRQALASTNYNGTGKKYYRPWCLACHTERTLSNPKNKGAKSITEVVAMNKGMTLTEYTNSIHPYRKYRKDYCENKDGRLGFVCTATIIWDGQLDTDHINGDPSDHREVNMQTLCKNCHAFKTNANKDYATPGRTFFGISL